jgi:hypothetical protein
MSIESNLPYPAYLFMTAPVARAAFAFFARKC